MKQSKRNLRNAAAKAEREADGKPRMSRYERKTSRAMPPAPPSLGPYNPNAQDV